MISVRYPAEPGMSKVYRHGIARLTWARGPAFLESSATPILGTLRSGLVKGQSLACLRSANPATVSEPSFDPFTPSRRALPEDAFDDLIQDGECQMFVQAFVVHDSEDLLCCCLRV